MAKRGMLLGEGWGIECFYLAREYASFPQCAKLHFASFGERCSQLQIKFTLPKWDVIMMIVKAAAFQL